MIAHQVIKSILGTEKSSRLEPQNKYLLLVDIEANKLQIRRAVEDVYKVKVCSVNTFVYKGKVKRVRRQEGRTPDTKKALVTLKEGQKLEIV
ncbi:MAG: 50S ribosomal protein L23 [Candidatus Omnitrophota bacterium]|jgi:large subunit ribosomal protein L23